MEKVRCKIEVAAGEIRYENGESGIDELIEEFESVGIEIIETTSGLYNGDEDWVLEGTQEILESVLTELGWDVSEIEFEEI